MTLVTSGTESAATEELLKVFLARLKKLRRVIDDLNEQAADGEDIDFSAAQKLLSPAEGLVRSCMKLEANLAEQRNKELGIARGGYAVDLDAARFEIGCRLARLRTCCETG